MGLLKAVAQRGSRGQAWQQRGWGQEAEEVAWCWGWKGGRGGARAEVGAGAAE